MSHDRNDMPRKSPPPEGTSKPFGWTDGQASVITGVPRGTFQSMRARGTIPAGPLSDVRVLALAVSRGLRARGVGVDHAGDVLDWLWHRVTLERLEADLARGARWLLVAADLPPLCRLVTLASVTNNPEVPPEAAYMAGVTLVNVGTVWSRIQTAKRAITARRKRGRR